MAMGRGVRRALPRASVTLASRSRMAAEGFIDALIPFYGRDAAPD